MNLNVYQNIVIHNLRVNSISNSSVLQIGSAGMIKSLSNLYNTGGFIEPAPPLVPGVPVPTGIGPSPISLVPLPAPAGH